MLSLSFLAFSSFREDFTGVLAHGRLACTDGMHACAETWCAATHLDVYIGMLKHVKFGSMIWANLHLPISKP